MFLFGSFKECTVYCKQSSPPLPNHLQAEQEDGVGLGRVWLLGKWGRKLMHIAIPN